MIKLYTSKGCSRCAVVKNILEQKGIEFQTIMFEDLAKDEQERMMQRTEAADIYSFPVIEKEDGSITNRLEEI